MSGFFSKLFGGKKENGSIGFEGGDATSTVALVEETLAGVIERAGFDLEFSARSEMKGEIEEVSVEVTGADEDILVEENGELLESFQLFIKRVVQHKMPEARVEVNFDSNGFREKATSSLVELADKLKDKCLESGKSQYMRALAPKDRKIVHQHLANDERVRSRSIGEGLFKKIKIYPAKQAAREEDGSREDSVETV